MIHDTCEHVCDANIHYRVRIMSVYWPNKRNEKKFSLY